jgi:membrane-bound lytic murein transglycosylase B
MSPRTLARRIAHWSRPRRTLAVAGVLVLASVAAPAGAARQDPPPTTSPPGATDGPPPLWERLPDDRLSPGLIQLPVDSRAYRAAIETWEATTREIAELETTITTREGELAAHLARRVVLRDQYDAAQRERTVALADLDIIQRAIDHLAVRRYTSGGPGTEAIDLLLSPDPAGDVYTRQVAEQFSDVQLEKLDERRARVEQLETDVAATTEALVGVGTAIVDTNAALDDARARLADLRERLPAREQAVRDRRLGATVEGTDLSLVALDAYVKGAARSQSERPSCGMQWWMLAALGRIESRHGTIFGSEVRPDGRTSIRIIGIALDGDNRTMRIDDTDGGELDGDTTYDRAVGPMQFIPETWRSFRRDGNGDGTRDPHNVYDASASAAAYLCARGGDLSGTDALRGAYFSYNRSTEYVNTAVSNGDTYRRLTWPSG